MSYGVARSELLTENTVLRRVQGAVSYKFRIGLDISREVRVRAKLMPPSHTASFQQTKEGTCHRDDLD
jgi:hypothetical protein